MISEKRETYSSGVVFFLLCSVVLSILATIKNKIKAKHFVLDKKRQQSFSLVYKCRELCSAVWVHVALSALSFD